MGLASWAANGRAKTRDFTLSRTSNAFLFEDPLGDPSSAVSTALFQVDFRCWTDCTCAWRTLWPNSAKPVASCRNREVPTLFLLKVSLRNEALHSPSLDSSVSPTARYVERFSESKFRLCKSGGLVQILPRSTAKCSTRNPRRAPARPSRTCTAR